MTERPAIEHRIELDNVSDSVDYEVEPNADERRAIAEWLGLDGLDRLLGAFTISRVQGGATVRLNLSAAAKRTCVVSLEPMTENVSETIEIHFLKDFAEFADDEEGDERAREPWPDDALDLAALLVDHLALSLSPHPRKEGAASLVEAFGRQSLSSPFDKLRELVDEKSKPAS
jgi:uncharacterized metal-binding protein YceD (DUF177 family)